MSLTSLWLGFERGYWVAVARHEQDGAAVVRFVSTREGGATVREVLAARGVIEGAALKEIAHAIGVTTSSAARYVSRAFQRLAVTTRGELVALASLARDVTVDGRTEVEIRVAPPRSRPEAPLTPAEREVIDAVLAGCPVSVIAERRGVSPRTVVQQTGNAYEKLGVRSRAELVAFWGAVA
jgi:DNA-binding NarL/FixJ family response regulator